MASRPAQPVPPPKSPPAAPQFFPKDPPPGFAVPEKRGGETADKK
jgi:hypothetical protein